MNTYLICLPNCIPPNFLETISVLFALKFPRVKWTRNINADTWCSLPIFISISQREVHKTCSSRDKSYKETESNIECQCQSFIYPTEIKEQRNREYRYRMSIIHMLFVISMAILSSVSSMETETLEKALQNCQPSTLPYLPLK